MGGSDSERLTMIGLLAGALVTIAVGLYLVAVLGWYGWIVVGFGIVDLITIPFWLSRMSSARKQAEREAISTGDAGTTPAEASAENPYARED